MPAKWRHFLEVLERSVPLDAHTLAVAAAVSTFAAVENLYHLGLDAGTR